MEEIEIQGDIIGFDANVLVDIVESDVFKRDLREQVNIGVMKIFTTNVALGEAREVLIRKRGYSHEKAIEQLQNILNEFNIIKIEHNAEGTTNWERYGLMK